MTRRQYLRRAVIALIAVFVIGLLLPQNALIPVQGASVSDWNPQSFWFEPWGKSGVHKGIDIFAKQGTPVLAATSGVVVYRGSFGDGGLVVAVLGPKWRIHYYAHLAGAGVSPLQFVAKGHSIGVVGTSGNARGKQPHLHYAIVSLVPLPWHFTSGTQGWRRMFYLSPSEALIGA